MEMRRESVERKQFAAAQSDLNVLYDNIVKQVGSPDDHQAVQACRYTSVEIGQGSRSCGIDIYLVYRAADSSEAENLTNKISTVISTSTFKVNDATEGTTDRNVNNIKTEKFSDNGLSCVVDYWYFNNGILPYATGSYTTNVSNGIFTDLSCWGAARAEYYPVTSR